MGGEGEIKNWMGERGERERGASERAKFVTKEWVKGKLTL
jgi:hypothetical protein